MNSDEKNPPTSESFESTLAQRLREGWTIKSDTQSGVQLAMPRKLTRDQGIGIAAGVILLVFPPVGLLVLMIVGISYWRTKPKMEFLIRPK